MKSRHSTGVNKKKKTRNISKNGQQHESNLHASPVLIRKSTGSKTGYWCIDNCSYTEYNIRWPFYPHQVRNTWKMPTFQLNTTMFVLTTSVRFYEKVCKGLLTFPVLKNTKAWFHKYEPPTQNYFSESRSIFCRCGLFVVQNYFLEEL